MNSKNIVKYGLIAMLVFTILFLSVKSCNIYDNYSVLKGQYNLLQTENNTLIKVSQKEITEYQNTIAERDTKIKEISATIAVKNKKIQDLHIATQNLEDTLDFYTLIPNEDKIVNLQKQVKVWKKKFTISESIIKDLGQPIEYYDEHGVKKIKYPEGSITFNLQEKYNTQLKISLNYKEMYEKSQQLVLLADKRLIIADRKIRNARLGSTVKTIVIGTVVGFVIYDKVVK